MLLSAAAEALNCAPDPLTGIGAVLALLPAGTGCAWAGLLVRDPAGPQSLKLLASSRPHGEPGFPDGNDVSDAAREALLRFLESGEDPVQPGLAACPVRQAGSGIGFLCLIGSPAATDALGREGTCLAGLLAYPLRNLLLEETLTRQKLFRECSEQLVARLAAGAPESDLFDYLARFLGRVFDAEMVLLYTLTEDRRWLIPVAYHDKREWARDKIRVKPLSIAEDQGIPGLLEAGVPMQVSDLSRPPFPPAWLTRAAAARMGAVAVVPLKDVRGLWGVAVLARERAGQVLTPGDLDLFRTLIEHSGPLLQNCRMVRELRQSLEGFNLLFETSRDVSSVLDLSEVPRIAARRGLELTGSDECLLFFLEPDEITLRPVMAISRFEAEVMNWRARVGEGIVGHVAKTRVGEYVNRADLDPRHRLIPGTPAEPEALLAVPLLCADRLIGVMSLYKLAGREYTGLELAAVTVFATQAAVAIENARLFEHVAAERNRLSAMIHQMKEAVFFCDAEGKVLLVNPAATRLAGGDEAPEGRPFLEIFQPDLRQALEGIDQRVRQGGERYITREMAVGGRVVLAGFTAIHDDRDRVTGMVVLARDITDIRSIEAQLLQTSKMSAVGQLASGVSHEFNNLIAAIYGYAQFMKESRDEKILAKGIDVILKSSERARELTRSLLTFSTSTGGHREAVNLNDVVADALLLVEQQLARERIRVVRHLEPLAQIRADRGSLQEVFLNLISNARHAMPRGGTLTFTTRQAGSEVIAEVADTGTGIPAGDMGRIFDPFFTTKGPLGGAPTPGTGLGLTTAYNTVTAHGGRLEATSVVGEGSLFRIILPARAGSLPARAAAA